MKQSKRFTAAMIEAAKPADAAYRIWDTVVPRLFVRVQPGTGRKVFNVQWDRRNSRKLGVWPGCTVEAARARALAALVETDQQGAPAAVLEERRPEADKPITFGEFVRDHYAPHALAHQKQGQATLDNLEAQFAELNEKPLTEICAFDIERFKSRRLRAGIKPATVNRDLDRIRAVLSRAVEWGRLPAHPLKTVKRARGEDDSRVRYLSAAEEKRLRAALAKREAQRRKDRASGNAWLAQRGREARPQWTAQAFTDHLAPLVLLAMNTGLRRGELFGLKWSDVNQSARMLTVPAGVAKSRRARHVPLNDEALEVLKRWRGKDASGLVFPGTDGSRITNINKAWDSLTTAAALEDFRFHDLRHHFASRMVQAGVDLYAVRGNCSDTRTSR